MSEPMLLYDLSGWTKPEECVGCVAYPDAFIMHKACPVHGVRSGPEVREGDLPPIKVVYT